MRCQPWAEHIADCVGASKKEEWSLADGEVSHSSLMIGRAGLAEGQSALTDRGAGDARCVLRMAGERWRCTRNKISRDPLL